MKSFLAFTQFHRRGDTTLRDPVEWDLYISLLGDDDKDVHSKSVLLIRLDIIANNVTARLTNMLGRSSGWVSSCQFRSCISSFSLEYAGWSNGLSSQCLSTFKKVTNCEFKWDKSRMQFCRCLPIFARIYAQAPTAVAGNKLTLELNSIEQDSAVANLSRFWINFQTFLFS